MKEYIQKIDTLGELYLVKKAPFQLPERLKTIIVKYWPYVSAVSLILSIPPLLALLGISAFLSPIALFSGVRFGYGHTIAVTTSILTLILSAISIPKLLNKSLIGWRYAWYIVFINALASLLTLQLFSMIIGLVISLYFLYQIKSYYK